VCDEVNISVMTILTMFKMISCLDDHSLSQSVDELDEFSGHDCDVALLIT
jgi:hypothetical protein